MSKSTKYASKSSKIEDKIETLTVKYKTDNKLKRSYEDKSKIDEDLDSGNNSIEQSLYQIEPHASKMKKVSFTDQVKVRFILNEPESKIDSTEDEIENNLCHEEERIDMIMHWAESMCDDSQASKLWFCSSDLIRRVIGESISSMPSTSSVRSTSSGSMDSLPESKTEKSRTFLQICWTGIKSFLSLETLKGG